MEIAAAAFLDELNGRRARGGFVDGALSSTLFPDVVKLLGHTWLCSASRRRRLQTIALFTITQKNCLRFLSSWAPLDGLHHVFRNGDCSRRHSMMGSWRLTRGGFVDDALSALIKATSSTRYPNRGTQTRGGVTCLVMCILRFLLR
jgi:hypothetical protein